MWYMPRPPGKDMSENVAHSPTVDAALDLIYSLDLVYRPECWKLCGDAHCCHHSRHKAKLPMPGAPYTDLALLPGELSYMQRRGLLIQYQSYEVQELRLPLSRGELRVQSLKIPGQMCPCKHDIRP